MLDGERLCTHNMRIVEEIELDDLSGHKTKRFRLKVWSGTAKEPKDEDAQFVSLDTARFERMDWLIEDLGAAAFVEAGAGTRDQLRQGVQELPHRPMFDGED